MSQNKRWLKVELCTSQKNKPPYLNCLSLQFGDHPARHQSALKCKRRTCRSHTTVIRKRSRHKNRWWLPHRSWQKSRRTRASTHTHIDNTSSKHSKLIVSSNNSDRAEACQIDGCVPYEIYFLFNRSFNFANGFPVACSRSSSLVALIVDPLASRYFACS